MTQQYRPQTGQKNRLPRGGNHCDFCGGFIVAKLYACRNFDWDGRPVFGSAAGRWAACDVCGDHIDAGRWADLVSRVMRAVRKRNGINSGELSRLRCDLRLLYTAVNDHLLHGQTLAVHQMHYERHAG